VCLPGKNLPPNRGKIPQIKTLRKIPKPSPLGREKTKRFFRGKSKTV